MLDFVGGYDFRLLEHIWNEWNSYFPSRLQTGVHPTYIIILLNFSSFWHNRIAGSRHIPFFRSFEMYAFPQIWSADSTTRIISPHRCSFYSNGSLLSTNMFGIYEQTSTTKWLTDRAVLLFRLFYHYILIIFSFFICTLIWKQEQ